MELKAPGTGVLVFSLNYSQGWMNAKQFKVGDNVFAGMFRFDAAELLQATESAEERKAPKVSFT